MGNGNGHGNGRDTLCIFLWDGGGFIFGGAKRGKGLFLAFHVFSSFDYAAIPPFYFTFFLSSFAISQSVTQTASESVQFFSRLQTIQDISKQTDLQLAHHNDRLNKIVRGNEKKKKKMRPKKHKCKGEQKITDSSQCIARLFFPVSSTRSLRERLSSLRFKGDSGGGASCS